MICPNAVCYEPHGSFWLFGQRCVLLNFLWSFWARYGSRDESELCWIIYSALCELSTVLTVHGGPTLGPNHSSRLSRACTKFCSPNFFGSSFKQTDLFSMKRTIWWLWKRFAITLSVSNLIMVEGSLTIWCSDCDKARCLSGAICNLICYLYDIYF